MLLRYGRYELLRKIAAGGMATVFLGRVSGEGGFERRVAVKVMHDHIASDPEFVAMFLDEARLAAMIHHPNVVSTLDIQRTDEATFLVMDYVDGPSLQRLRKHLSRSGKRIPIDITLRLFLDVLNGLQAAHDLTDAEGHSLHLVHRDVSPHNILVGVDGVTRLTDFGVARAEERLTTTKGAQLKGKIAYMAPEQLLAEPITRRVDIFAAGVCMWEMLAGRRLFTAPSEGALVRELIEGTPPTINSVASCPVPVEQVVMQAISKDATLRFAEALDMADAIERAALQAGIRIARVRDVGAFIRDVVQGVAASSPGDAAPTPSEGVSKPSMPSFTAGPSLPSSSREPALAPGLEEMGPSTPAAAATSSLGRFGPEIPEVDVGELSQPSVATSTASTYSLAPGRSRRGMVAKFLLASGLAALGLVFAVMLMVERVTDEPSSPHRMGAVAPQGDTTAVAPEPALAASAEDDALASTNPDDPSAGKGGAAGAEPEAEPKKKEARVPRHVKRPRIRRPPAPAPAPPPPPPAQPPTQFRPEEL